MKTLTLRLWRHPPREELVVDGVPIDADAVVVELRFEDVPMTTTLGELFGTFDHMTVVERAALAHPECPSCRCHPALVPQEGGLP